MWAELTYLRVVAGILSRSDGHVLIAERIGDSPLRGLWEFPGGKIAADEGTDRALARELLEELGVETLDCAHFMQLEHRYADRHVSIDFFLVRAWSGEPEGRDGQGLRWVHIDDLEPADLLPADAPVVAALKTALDSWN